MRKVLFDTDIGIDDAMALLFLHYSPDVDLKAIVTGFGNAAIDDTTRNALFVKEQFGIDAPVFRGAAEPLGVRLGSGFPDFVHGRNGLGDIDMEEPALACESLSGADAIVQFARAFPGELSVVAVGRLTNLALALDRCHDLPALLQEVVIMGGAFGHHGHRGNVTPVAEANIGGDPVAADRVLSSGMPLTIVGLDVTQQTVIGEPFFADLAASAGRAGEFIHRISRCYLDFHQRISGRRECPMHDSSAVARLLDPGAYATTEAAVRVATDGVAMGQTIAGDPGADYASLAWRDRPLVRICTDANVPAILVRYLDTLSLARDQL